MFRKYISKDDLIIELPETIFQEIQLHVDKLYPNECGGVFVGNIKDDVTARIDKMVLPKKTRSTPVYFVRLTSFINRWLLNIFKKYNGEVIYLGEWHSHPNGTPFPSGTDLKTMREIAINPDIRIQTPILLIVGYDKRTYNEIFYMYKNNKLIPYSYDTQS